MTPLKPEKISVPDFYQYAVHLIFAIIVATSFELATEILIPIDGAFIDKNNFGLATPLCHIRTHFMLNNAIIATHRLEFTSDTHMSEIQILIDF